MDLSQLIQDQRILFLVLGIGALLAFLLVRRLFTRPERTLRREAEAAIKRGNLREAARIFQAIGNEARALELYAQGGFFLDAAQMLLNMGKREQAAAFYEKAGRTLDAARLYEELRQWENAARLYEKSGNFTKAAEIFESQGKLEEAAALYIKSGLLDQAASLYEKRKRWDLLGPVLYRLFLERKGLLRHPELPEKKRKEIHDLGLKALEILAKVKSFSEAVEIAEELGEFRRVAELYKEAGDPDRAIEFLLKHNQYELAIELLEQQGKAREAKTLRARMHEENGEHQQAGAIYEELGEYELAQEQYRFAGNYARAAQMAEKLGKWEEAAQYYFKTRDLHRAAELLEKAKAWGKAALIYQRMGKMEKVVELLVLEGRLLEAALQAREARMLKRMEEILLEIGKNHPDYKVARANLAEYYQKTGALLKAVESYEEALVGEEVRPGNLQAFYEYGNLLEKLNRRKEALDIWNKILRFDPQYRDVRERRERYREEIKDQRTPTPSPSTSKKVRYALMQEIGRGGMGIVYKALDRVLDRIVALKILPSSVKDNPTAIDNFIKTTKRASALVHPNIVVIFDAGEQEKSYYIAMEYLSGKDLREILNESGPFPLPFFLLVVGQIAKGLGYAHSRKVLHLDIKPSNILWVPEEKQVKITDFGLSHAIQEVANYQTVVGGTPNYMSPEQIIGDSLDPRSDIYSLGVMMYELSTGKLPFAGLKGDVGYHQVHTTPPPPSRFRPDLPAPLESIILKCLEKEPNQRFATMEELFQALQKIHKGV